MHILATTTASLDDLIEPVDLRQAPADMVALSFTDSDLAGLAAAWRAEGVTLPSMRLAALRDLRHPMSVDLWVDAVAAHARIILVRVLGGYDWWRYGCDRLAALARKKGIALALLPGEGQGDDSRLAERSTVSAEERAALLAYFREGGPGNMRALARRLAYLAGRGIEAPAPVPLAKAGFYAPDRGIVPLDFFTARLDEARALVPILFYRSMLLASDVAPIDALSAALEKRGFLAVPIFVSSLRDGEAAAFVQEAAGRLRPSALVTATAFSNGAEPGEKTLFDRLGLPVFQVITATTRRKAWQEGQRGLAPADLAMHVVLPELDGRIMAGAISFKDEADIDDGLSFGIQRNRPEETRVEQAAARIAALLALQAKPRGERRIVILIPDYPSAPGRTGYAVGLDVPASVLAMLHDLKEAGYGVGEIPATSRDLMRLLEKASEPLPLSDYRPFFDRLPEAARNAVKETWGEAEDKEFRFRAAHFGNVTVALAPDRGSAADRRADYHDPALAPRHALLAFGAWLREKLEADALIHVGAHGTLEWLPGKTVALTETCFPEIVTGALPVVYPFIVSNPGEAAQAKRRIGAVTLGHLTPPLAGAGLSDEERELERLVDEYAQADGLDRRRRDRLARLIVETAQRTGLSREAGVEDTGDTDAALMKIDAWLCDLKDFAIKDGLHIYGRGQQSGDTPESSERAACAEAERTALLAALDGRHIPPGPSGAPARGRTDVLPTGRNLFTADPRTLPTPTASALGKMAADEAVRGYCQEHGEWPRALVIDLWGSASLRTGGEEIAQGLALMGCRPQWDNATGRVTGIEVLPPASIGRPRIDVTWRISGLFRDMFPTQIALLDTAIAAVAARNEADGENPLAAAARSTGKAPARIFGSAPGTYGAGIEERLSRGDWRERTELGQAYLDAASHAFGGAEGEGHSLPGAFAAQVAGADMLIHTGDDAGRDILEGSADVAFIGGFSAAVAALGGKADVVVLDTTDPECPRARSLAQAIARTVRARAINPRFIAGQMRHGPRGAAELTETVDRLVGFAETTEAVSSALIDAVFDAYLGDEAVRGFLLHENPTAARAMAERFRSARRRGLWHARRNTIDDDLAALIAEAESEEATA
ncbi:cobaltochelatase subunit CobN [Nitratireductor luteus]|uniref:cobaltochelatase subunit CobN n=1 Tax=Nitratireductor luteus TaxID=2976980 RepID=UPI00223FE14C|nr:cobaltochelatase subunit CobN [Nitratireductor luteus]